MNISDTNKNKITRLIKLSPETKNKLIKASLICSNKAVGDDGDFKKLIETLEMELNLNIEELYDYLGLLIKVIKLLYTTDNKEFVEKFLEIGCPNEFIDILISIKSKHQQSVPNTITNGNIYEAYYFQKLQRFKWRIDISLNENILQEKAIRTVIFGVKIKNDHKKTISVDIKTFHKLRFNIALILKEIIYLKQTKAFPLSNLLGNN